MSNDTQELDARVLLTARREAAPAEAGSMMSSFRRAINKFVTWIDNVDVDGQEYWS